MRTIVELRQAIAAAGKELRTLAGDKAAYDAKEAEILTLEGELDRAEKAEERERSLAQPHEDNRNDLQPEIEQISGPEMRAIQAMAGFEASPNSRGFDVNIARRFQTHLRNARRDLGFRFEAQRHFRSLGEQLQAIQQYYITKGTTTDPRLVRAATDRFNRAPTGASEIDPTGGGFLVQIDFATAIFMLAHDLGAILGATNKIPISSGANGLKVPGVDETSRASGSRWGGVASTWVGEGTSVTASKPKFRLVEFDLKKLMSVMYATDEMIQDASVLGSIAGQAFSEEIVFMVEDAIYEGDGVGKPLGVINSPALVSVAKETGQAAGTIIKENIDKMWSRMWSRSRSRASWYINQDCEPQLNALAQVVGVGGIPAYLPPGGLSQSPYGTLYGRPVVANEYSAALGTVGDILFADFSQYTIVDKGGVNMAQSMHVAFLTDEMVYRLTYRVDGKPMWNSALTPFKGSNTKSPFVALAAR